MIRRGRCGARRDIGVLRLQRGSGNRIADNTRRSRLRIRSGLRVCRRSRSRGGIRLFVPAGSTARRIRRCGFLFPHLPRRCCPARSVPARSIRSAHLEERGISEADCLYIGSGGYRGSGYRIDIASVLTHGHLHLRRTFAEKTCLDRIALLGEFRPETRSLRLFQHLYVPYPAVGPEPTIIRIGPPKPEAKLSTA